MKIQVTQEAFFKIINQELDCTEIDKRELFYKVNYYNKESNQKGYKSYNYNYAKFEYFLIDTND